jgi:rhodanese-related sulfurtransferase
MSLLNLFGRGSPPPDYRVIDVKQAEAGLRAGELVVIDVRRPEEWLQTGRPIGAHGVVLQDPAFFEKIAVLTKGNMEVPLALFCRSGNRSGEAAAALVRAGFSNVANIKGGVIAWYRAGLSLEPYTP